MATAVLVLAAIIVGGLLRELIRRRHWTLPELLARRRRRRQLVECTGCGRTLRRARAETLLDLQEAHDGGPGGTAVSTDWHPRCLRQAQKA